MFVMNKRNMLILFFFLYTWGHFFFSSHILAATPELETSVEYALQDGEPLAVVWLDISSEYHAYAHASGSAGKPTELVITGKEGGAPRRIWYPQGKEQHDIFDPTSLVHIYEGKTPLFVDLAGVAPGSKLQGHLELLLCSEKRCIPIERKLSLTLPLEPLSEAQNLPWNTQWQSVRKHAVGSTRLPKVSERLSSPGSDVMSPLAAASVYKNVTPEQPQTTAGEPWHFSPRHIQESLEVSGLGKALLLGVLAGLLLNVMPCVLPVLTLKISALLMLGDEEDKSVRLRRFRTHNLFFAAGILSLFTLLALIFSAAGYIWGQLFQSPTVVLGMLIVVFLLGLSMLGLFTLPVIDLKADVRRSPRAQAYFTGMMATLLATPCSGPLLGGVLGWAFTQPLPVLVVIFLAVGGGMSLPYIVFALRPALATFLPRPGAWMGVLERLVGFFLMGTSLYLLSLLPSAQYMPTLTALLVVAFGGWIWGRFCGYDAPPKRRRVLGSFVAVLILGTVFLVTRSPAEGVVWETFSEASFRAELGNQPLLLEFTADWCPNCKALERATLTDDNLRRWRDAYNLRLIRVDLTRSNPTAQHLLQALGSSSIPLTAIFPRGLAASAPVVLRDIYTPATMERALQKAFPVVKPRATSSE